MHTLVIMNTDNLMINRINELKLHNKGIIIQVLNDNIIIIAVDMLAIPQNIKINSVFYIHEPHNIEE